MDFSIELEAISLIILAILGLFHYDSNNKHERKYQWFNGCLALSAAAIVSDLLTCLMLTDISAYPIGLHMIANSIYFIAINSSMSLTAAYVFYIMFSHMRDQKCYKIAVRLISYMYAIVTFFTIINPWTGCYFYFEDNTYQRGPLNKLSFLVVIIEIMMLCMCYYRNRKVVTPYAGQLVRTLPPLVTLIVVVQMWIPNTILTGTMAALVNLIVFACFQNNRIGRDALTELPDRVSFFKKWNYYKKKYETSHVILVHIRHMDKVNKRFGIKNGDSFLYQVARYLDNQPGVYSAYRFGNTHFLLFGEFRSMDMANEIADSIFERFNQPWNINGEMWTQQVQLIHMKLDTKEMDANVLIDYMNYMLVYSKRKNESTKAFFDEKLKAAYERKCYVLNEVKRALRQESFVLYFQPIYSCEKEKFVTAEVLLRLFNEDGVMISPGEFIPIADENGLSDDISWFVLKNSMDFIMRNPDIPLESISINMSVQQMRKSVFDEKLAGKEELYLSHIDKIRVEITEDAITQNAELVTNVMQTLESVGLKFYLDDFGMGYSNFSRVFDLPFEVVKLDRSLVRKIDEDEGSFRIVKSLVDMLHGAGYMVLAEGVERETQVAKAKEIGIDRIQGFYYAKPMNEQALLEFLGNA